MKPGFLLSSFVLALALTPATALAGDWYVEADVGQAKYVDLDSQFTQRLPFGNLVSVTARNSSNGTAYRLSGGYQFNEYWGLELGYVDLGEGDVSQSDTIHVPGPTDLGLVEPRSDVLSFKVQAWSLSGTASYPLTDDLSFFARLGAIQYQATEDLNFMLFNSTSSVEDTASGSQITLGIGVDYSLTSTWALRLGLDEYRHIGNTATGQGDIRLLSLGILRRF